MNLPQRFWEVRFASIQGAGQEVIRKYLSDGAYMRGDGLMVWGAYGVGKSAAAALVLMEMRRRGYSCLWAETQDFTRKVLDGEEFDLETSWMQRAKDVDVLVLDDMGAEHHDSQGAIEKLIEGLLRHRFQRRKVVLVTCNISPEKLGPHMNNGVKVPGIYRQKFLEIVREALYPVEIRGRSLRAEDERRMAVGYESGQ
jgi:DNA replication protein DnaC